MEAEKKPRWFRLFVLLQSGEIRSVLDRNGLRTKVRLMAEASLFD